MNANYVPGEKKVTIPVLQENPGDRKITVL